jgi:hypothetical protein
VAAGTVNTLAAIVLVLAMSLVFIVPFIRREPKPPEKPPDPPKQLPKPPDLRSLDEKVEEYVRIRRAMDRITKRQRRTAERQARRDWKRKFKDLTKPKEEEE